MEIVCTVFIQNCASALEAQELAQCKPKTATETAFFRIRTVKNDSRRIALPEQGSNHAGIKGHGTFGMLFECVKLFLRQRALNNQTKQKNWLRAIGNDSSALTHKKNTNTACVHS